jgi:uncharacterized membrane protein|tara:strand:+ start:741 stop:1037 length:297 start_codon:yes stop_codon:yes gene_type:complete
MSEQQQRDSLPEYHGERDMDAFWRAVKLKKEPSKQKWLIPALIVLIVFSVPWYRSEGQMGNVLFGFPVWIWSSIVCSLGVAILTAIGILRYWKDDDAE